MHDTINVYISAIDKTIPLSIDDHYIMKTEDLVIDSKSSTEVDPSRKYSTKNSGKFSTLRLSFPNSLAVSWQCSQSRLKIATNFLNWEPTVKLSDWIETYKNRLGI